MPKAKRSTSRRYLRFVVYLILTLLLIALVSRQRHSFEQALEAIRHADVGWLLLGVIAMFASLPATALVYLSLSPKYLQFGRTTLVQTAGFCVNKLLPSGSGAAGTSFLYLRANKVQAVQAGSIVVLNSLLGFVGHFLLFCILLAFQPEAISALNIERDAIQTGVALFGSAVILAVGFGILLRAKLQRLRKPLRMLLANPSKLLRALGASMLITLCYVLSLYASAHAVDVHITLTMAIIVLSASVLATAVVPTPGGIGAAEAGAYGGLLAFGVDERTALAAALLYRVCTFWVPLLVGSIAFVIVAKRGYLKKQS